MLSASVAASADDIVFSSARVVKRGKAYFQTEPAHLYRSRGDGTQRRLLTTGPMDDTEPYRSPDGTRILFWRRDREDLIGRTWLCSILPDGSDLRVLKRVKTANHGSPLTAFTGANQVQDLPGIPSKEGGTSMPQNISRLQDGSYVFGYFWRDSLLGMADAKGKPLRRFLPYKIVRGKKVPVSLSGDEQWEDNPDGAKAFWIGAGRRQLLMQRVERGDAEGFPTLTFLDAHTGRISRQIKEHFLEDVDSKRREFLTTSWRWGSDDDFVNGEVALRPLSLWKSRRRVRTLTPRRFSCFGACYVRTSKPLPERPNAKQGISIPKPSFNHHDIVFAASVYGEHLGNVYEVGPSRLYRIRPDGTGLRALTHGSHFDVQPTLTKDGERILFWRSGKAWQGPYRLYSIALDGRNLRRLGPTVDRYPHDELARAMLHMKRGVIRRESEDYGHEITIRDPRGKPLASDKDAFFSPNGFRAIVRGKAQGAIVDLKTGASKSFDSRWLSPAWVDDRTIVAFRAKGDPDEVDSISGEIAYLDLQGRPILRKGTDFRSYPGILPGMFSYYGRAVRLENRYRLLWEAFHPSSDGGYDFLHLIDAHRGTIRYLADQSLEAVSPNGRTFIGTDYAWVGGYKGAGAAKLGTMYLWNAKTLNRKPFGFRRMICYGACFVPGI